MKTENRRIVKVVRKYRLGEEPDDLDYWLSRPYSERLRALFEIRREHHAPRDLAGERLQRVYRIAKRSRG